MEKSNQQDVVSARTQLKRELKALFNEVIRNNPRGGVSGIFFLITFPQVTKLEQLVASYADKGHELSVFFAKDPAGIIAEIRKGIPSYDKPGEEQTGYAIRHSLLLEILAMAVPGQKFSLLAMAVPGEKRELDVTRQAAADPAVKADFEQWYREEVSTEPLDLEKWNNCLYVNASTHDHFVGFLGGLSRRQAATEAPQADQATNVQPRIDALLSLAAEQLARSRAVTGI